MIDYRAIVSRLVGPLAPIMPAFNNDESLNIDATCNWVDWMIQGGIKLFWTTAGSSHYLCLTDDEIISLNRELARTIGERAIFIASNPWQWAAADVRRFVEDTAGWGGVDIVKVQQNWQWSPSADQVVARYTAIARDSPLPLFAYAFPPDAATNGLLERVIELPVFVGLKNDTDQFRGQLAFMQTVERTCGLERFIVMPGGGLPDVVFAHDYGLRAYGDVTPWFSPAASLTFARHIEANDHAACVNFIREWEQPLRGILTAHKMRLWSFGHTAAMLLGHFPSDQMRFPVQRASPDAVAAVRGYLEAHHLL